MQFTAQIMRDEVFAVELNNLIQALFGNVTLVQRQVTLDQLRQRLNRIRRDGERGFELLDTFLQFLFTLINQTVEVITGWFTRKSGFKPVRHFMRSVPVLLEYADLEQSFVSFAVGRRDFQYFFELGDRSVEILLTRIDIDQIGA